MSDSLGRRTLTDYERNMSLGWSYASSRHIKIYFHFDKNEERLFSVDQGRERKAANARDNVYNEQENGLGQSVEEHAEQKLKQVQDVIQSDHTTRAEDRSQLAVDIRRRQPSGGSCHGFREAMEFHLKGILSDPDARTGSRVA